ncbi:MAG: hypothetical protein ACTSU7_00120 [Candidatus Heimdallarchaeaceae archaeon]
MEKKYNPAEEFEKNLKPLFDEFDALTKEQEDIVLEARQDRERAEFKQLNAENTVQSYIEANCEDLE